MRLGLAGLAGLAVILGCAVGSPAWAQTKDFPLRPVRLVVPVPPGGSLDVMARIVSPKWGETLGQNVIIDYRPGANTIVGSENVARARARTRAVHRRRHRARAHLRAPARRALLRAHHGDRGTHDGSMGRDAQRDRQPRAGIAAG